MVEINRTPQRRNQFKLLSHGLLLVRDNSTRWNSWKEEIDSVFRLRVKEAINKYYDRFQDSKVDRLSLED
jgi:hypothetical protein